MFKKFGKLISKHLGYNQTTEIKTNTINVTFERNNASLIKRDIELEITKIKLPSLCNIIDQANSDCNRRVIFFQVSLNKIRYTLINKCIPLKLIKMKIRT